VVSYTAVSDGYREGLKYIRKLFDEGLVDPMSFTADEEQLRALVGGEVNVVGMTVGYDPEATYHTPRHIEYTYTSPFKNAEGKMVTTYFPSVPSVTTLITSDCDDPEAAFRFCDLLYRGDMGIVNHWGQEGVHWDWPQEGDRSSYYYLGYEPSFRQNELLWGVVQNVMWYQRGNWVREKEIGAGFSVELTPEQEHENEVMNVERLGDYINSYPEVGNYIPMLIYTAEETEAIGMIRTDLETYINTARTNFMLNKDGMDINDDASWNAYLEQLKVIGIDQVTETIQNVYNRMYAAK